MQRSITYQPGEIPVAEQYDVVVCGAMSGLLDEKMAAAGVTLLYLTRVVDMLREGARIIHLVLHNRAASAPCLPPWW